MAPRIIGKPGAYATWVASKKQRRIIDLAVFFMAILMTLNGALFGIGIGRHSVELLSSNAANGAIVVSLIVLIIFIIFFSKRLDVLTSEDRKLIDAYMKGAEGEAITEWHLMDLSDEYLLINGLESRYGDIDHLVIGPTGIWAIETKNWRGLVSADPSGKRLLLNTNTIDKDPVGQVRGVALTIRRQLCALTLTSRVVSEQEIFVQPVITFPLAWVESKKQIGKVVLTQGANLSKYISEGRVRFDKSKLSELKRAAQKLLADPVAADQGVTEILAADETASVDSGTPHGQPLSAAPDATLLRSRRDRKRRGETHD